MSSSFATFGLSVYDLAFQVSPIIMVGGIATGLLGNALPFLALTGELGGLVSGVASYGLTADAFFARFVPVPGGTIISNAAATYTFANQQTAANALIQNPNGISLQMIVPVKDTAGYYTKLALIASIKNSFQQHNQAGGWYYVATPANIYGPCLFLNMSDITSGETHQQQVAWQLDFTEPLITIAQAAAAQNSLLSKITGGQQIFGTPSWSGQTPSVGTSAPGALAGTLGSTNLPGAVNQFSTTSPQ